MLISVLAHAGAMAAVIIASILAPGILPTPRDLLAWGADRVVHLEDIPLPPPPVKRAVPRAGEPALQSNASAAPVVPPDNIAPETGLEGLPTPLRSTIDGLERVTGSIDGLGTIEPVPPAKPQDAGAPRRLHSGIEPPRKLVHVAPVYPQLARASRTEGVVILEATISSTGRVVSAHVLRSIPLLDDAAVAAVMQWKFAPARLNGDAVSVIMTVTVNFVLSQ
jgi:protein TonB